MCLHNIGYIWQNYLKLIESTENPHTGNYKEITNAWIYESSCTRTSLPTSKVQHFKLFFCMEFTSQSYSNIRKALQGTGNLDMCALIHIGTNGYLIMCLFVFCENVLYFCKIMWVIVISFWYFLPNIIIVIIKKVKSRSISTGMISFDNKSSRVVSHISSLKTTNVSGIISFPSLQGNNVKFLSFFNVSRLLSLVFTSH